MRIIFCDFDGVVNSQNWFAKTREGRLENVKNTRIYSEEQRHFEHKLSQIDPEAVNYLNYIIEKTNSFIVISSTWRLFTPLNELKQLLICKGFKYPDKIIDKTDNFNLSGCRGWEIHHWLNESKENIESFCCLDDDGDFFHLLKWLVRTKFDTGLDKESADLAIDLLLNPEKELTGWESIYKYFDCKDYGYFNFLT